jgi:rare lipoprotein A
MPRASSIAFAAAALLAAPLARGAQLPSGDDLMPATPLTGCYAWGAPPANPLLPLDDSLLRRVMTYADLQMKHRVNGLASYYSTFFDGRKTANGEIYRNRTFSAAHLTLPLGTWVEVKSRATGKKLRLRVNDRGPYAKKFCLDLSQAAARFLGVDVTPDRHVDIRIIALPGEEPLPENIDDVLASLAPVLSTSLRSGN